MGRMYSALMDAVAVTAAKDLLRLSAPADAALRIHEVTVTQENITASDQCAIQLQRASTDGTGTSGTARALSNGDPAFGGTFTYNLTANTTAGNILRRKGFNLLNGCEWVFTPEARIDVPPSGRFVVKLEDAPAASTTFTVEVIFEEIGG